ncbi:hypothetical protein [Anaeromyxobacter sp. Fw109-5]|uniref:hypothetical protein n=1 Tax=Anaeromyxobacter sp. (strain Fw109-5) TaxID=404589 RepID=UPI0002E68DBC|nr:hypothetical protein [Anaeromyxobacter sp. Fw109-5]
MARTEEGGAQTRRVVSGLYDDHDDVVFAEEVLVEVDVFGAETWATDAVDLWYTADALALRPVWTPVAALVPASAGPQTLTATLVLDPGDVQAVRAVYRDASAPQEACSIGPFADHDDLAFELAP